MAMTQGSLATMVAATAPADLRGTAFGMFNLVSGLALLADLLWDRWGAGATFAAGMPLPPWRWPVCCCRQACRADLQSPRFGRAENCRRSMPLKIPGFQPAVRAYPHHTIHELLRHPHPPFLQRRRR